MSESERLVWRIALGEVQGAEFDYHRGDWTEKAKPDAEKHRDAATVRK